MHYLGLLFFGDVEIAEADNQVPKKVAPKKHLCALFGATFFGDVEIAEADNQVPKKAAPKKHLW